VGFGENNLFGENKKLLLYGQVATGDSFFIGAYVDPSIKGTRFKWQLDAYLLSTRSIEYAAPSRFLDSPKAVRTSRLNYFNAGLVGGINLFHDASLELRVRGAKVFYDDVALAAGAEPAEVTGDPSTPADAIPEPGQEGYDVSGQLIIDYDRRANWYGISHGDRYLISVERALTDLGSDFDYWHARVYFQRARRYYSRHNLIVKSQLAYGRDLPFQQEFTSGGTDLRGYLNQHFRGDFRAALNAEYSMPLLSIKGVALRVLGFVDSTYTAFLDIEDTDTFRSYLPGHGKLGLTPFKNTVGVGTRLYVRQIVLPLLGIDVGYGLERGDYEVYLAIGLTDL
jgi:outer membrane protein insertion porin family